MLKVFVVFLFVGFLSVVMSSVCRLGSGTGGAVLEMDVLALENCHSSYACGYICSCGKFMQFKLDTTRDPYLRKVNKAVCLGQGSSHVVDSTSRAVRMKAYLKTLPSTVRTYLLKTFLHNPTTHDAIIAYMNRHPSFVKRTTSQKPSSEGVAEPQVSQIPLLQRWSPDASIIRLLEAKVEEETRTMAVDDEDDVAIDAGNTLSYHDGLVAVASGFTSAEVTGAVNYTITAHDVHKLVSLYSQNVKNFYIYFKNLCVRNMDPDATILIMEEHMVKKTSRETFNVIKKILDKISIKTTNEIVQEFQKAMLPVRQHILTTFEAIYNNATTLCQCKDMISAARTLKVPQSHITRLTNDMESLCTEACA